MSIAHRLPEGCILKGYLVTHADGLEATRAWVIGATDRCLTPRTNCIRYASKCNDPLKIKPAPKPSLTRCSRAPML